MAEFRTIRMSFWNDPYIEELDTGAKLLYIYLFTCPYSNNLGVIEITRRKIAFETGLTVDEVNRILAGFEKDGKVVLDAEESLILVTRFIRHQTSTSPKILIGLQALIPSIHSARIVHALRILYPEIFGRGLKEDDTEPVPSVDDTDTVPIPYPDGMDTLSKPYSSDFPATDTLSIPSGEIGNRKLEEGNRKFKNPPHPPLGGDEAGEVLCPPFEPEPKPEPVPVQMDKPKQRKSGNSLPELRQAIHAFTDDEALRQALEDFRVMRERIRKPLTGRALELILRDLETLAPGDKAGQVEIVNQSVKNSWQGIFPLKGPVRLSFSGKMDGNSLTERNAAIAAEVLASRQQWRQAHEQQC